MVKVCDRSRGLHTLLCLVAALQVLSAADCPAHVQLPSCATCEQPEVMCTNCTSGFVQHDGQCLDCPVHCDECSYSEAYKMTECDVCENNFYLDTTTTWPSCNRCVSRCDICSDDWTCEQCTAGYRVEDTRPVLCRDCPLGCATCIEGVDEGCLSCLHGYYYIPNAEHTGTCRGCRPRCLLCTGSDDCQQCERGYTWTGVACSSCINRCDPEYCITNGGCAKCIQGYSLVNTDFRQCRTCDHCVDCPDQGGCRQCESGYILNDDLTCHRCPDIENRETCAMCGTEDRGRIYHQNKCQYCPENCRICRSTTECTVCRDGYYELLGHCLRCDVSCNLCDSPGPSGCITCDVGYGLISKQCVVCSEATGDPYCLTCTGDTCTSCSGNRYVTYIPHATPVCRECSIGSDDETAFRCTQCQTEEGQGRYFEGGVCAGCDVFGTACLQCDITACYMCQDRYYLNTTDTTCYACSNNRCLQCTDNTALSCTLCEPGYYEVGGDCLPCVENCVECSTSHSCDVCQEEYFVNSASICTACRVANCQFCPTSPEVCSACQPGHYQPDNEQCIPCTVSDCLKCDDGPDTCTECDYGHYLLNGDCQVRCINDCDDCSSSMSSDFNSNTQWWDVECDRCEPDHYKLITDQCYDCDVVGCISCSAPGVCYECEPGYRSLGPDCIACDTNRCIDCAADEATCVECESGRKLDNNMCNEQCVVTDCFNCDSGDSSIDVDDSNTDLDLVCDTCVEAHILQSRDGCFECDDANCAECTTDYLTCTACDDGYRVDTGDCVACSTNCDDCTGATTTAIDATNSNEDVECTTCAANTFRAVIDVCFTCAGFNVATCNTADFTITTGCVEHYRLNGLGLCEECDVANCENCDTNVAMCDTCMDGYQMVDATTCQQCLSGCADCDAATMTSLSPTATEFTHECTTCFTKYHQDTQDVCLDCGISNCKTCSAFETCTMCEDGYYDNIGSCPSCDGSLYCATCSDGSSCDTCLPGTTSDLAGGCTTTCDVTNCGNCDSFDTTPQTSDSTQLDLNCDTCKDGYYEEVVAECLGCADPLCLTCSDTAVCTACIDGAGMLDGGTTCSSCGITACKTCDTTGMCTMCETGYRLVANTICLECVAGCADCDSSWLVDGEAQLCDTCEADKWETSSNSCHSCHASCKTCTGTSDTDCETCYDRHYLHGFSMCIACHADCLTCSGNTDSSCVSCDTANGKYLSGTSCLTCTPPCATCSEPMPGNCISCVSNAFMSSGTACTMCHSSCATCSDASSCDTCPSGKSINTGSGFCNTFECVANCGECTGTAFADCVACSDGYFMGASSCEACSTGCRTCIDNTATQCTSCLDGFAYYASGMYCTPCPGECPTGCDPDPPAIVDVICPAGTCIDGTFHDGTMCTACDTTCDTCSSSGTGGCDTCMAGRFDDNGICQLCTSPCATCVTSATTCTSCTGGMTLNPDDNMCYDCSGYSNCDYCDSSTCVQCNDAYRENYLTDFCQPCHASCKTCTGVADTDCATCEDGFFLNGMGQCQACHSDCVTCSAGGMSDCDSCDVANGRYASGGGCNICSAPCTTCSLPDADQCDSCASNAFMDGTTCTNCDASCATCSNDISCDTCPLGKVLNAGNGLCNTFECSSNCAACTGTTYAQCTACSDGYFMGASSCEACSTGCMTCTGTSATQCTSCSTDYVYYATGMYCSACHAECPTGCVINPPNNLEAICTPDVCVDGTYFSIANNMCETCHSSCATCSDAGALACTACATAYFDDGGMCTACTSPCATCITSATTCTSCTGAMTLNPTDNMCYDCSAFSNCNYCAGTCEQCDDGYRLNLEMDVCNACDSSCKTCTGVADTDCATCQDGFYLTTEGRCQGCHSECLTCTGPDRSECASCDVPNGKYLSNGFCEVCTSPCATCSLPDANECDSCITNAFMDGTGCTLCHTSCATCSDASSCDTCPMGSSLNSDTNLCNTYECAATNCAQCNGQMATDCTMCDDGYFFNVATCDACSTGCKTCTDGTATTCTTCLDGYAHDNTLMTCTACPVECPTGCDVSTPGTVGVSCGMNMCAEGYYFMAGSCLACSTGCSGCNDGSSSQCTACFNGYAWSSSALTCTACTAPCATCDTTATTCTSCTGGLTLNPDDDMCYDCSSYSNCAYCDGVTCVMCNDAYRVNSDTNLCNACDGSCKTCTGTAATDCASCNDGFFLDTTGACTACHTDCMTCSGAGMTDCLSCDTANGKYLDGGGCSTCTPPCATCSLPMANECDSCAAGAYMVGTTCMACDTTCATCSDASSCDTCPAVGSMNPSTGFCNAFACTANCAACTGTMYSDCTQCEDGYYMGASSCDACSTGCKTCIDGTASMCLSCLDGYVLDAHYMTCTACPTGCNTGCILDVPATVNVLCTTGNCIDGTYFAMDACMNCDPVCATCNGATNTDCVTCAAGYFDSGSGCDPCTPPCATCTGTATTCTSCTGGFTLNPDDAMCYDCTGWANCVYCTGLTCVQCSDGFRANMDTDICNACDASCKTCTGTEATDCASCDDGFFLDTTGECTACHTDCETCSGAGMSDCLSCDTANGKYLNSGTCDTCTSPCATCSLPNADQCDSCIPTAFMDGTACTPCHSSCATCSDATSCDTCPGGSSFNPTTQLCNAHACSTNCIECTSPMPIGCNTCEDGYFLAAAGCEACSAGCRTCLDGTATMCTSCLDGFAYDAHYMSCHACPGVCATGCAVDPPDTITVICTTGNCIDGTYFDSDACMACHSHCATCSGAADTDCTDCAVGRYADSTNCNECTSPCATCMGSDTMCTSCEASLTLNPTDNMCYDCSEWSNCVYCNATACVVCDEGYRPNHDPDVCNDCSVLNCVSCGSSGDTCTNCATGYKLSTDTTMCLQCISNCANCDSGDDGDLITCDACEGGYKLIPAYEICRACHSDCKNCFGILETDCTDCYDGFTLDTLGGCEPCSNQVTNCAMCNPQNGQCTECDPGYYPDVSGTMCLACGVSECAECALGDGATMCDRCNDGYYMLDPTSCGSCDPSCVTCSGATPSDCTGCLMNQFLMGGDPGTCTNCDPSCATCSDAVTCDSCPSPGSINHMTSLCNNFDCTDANCAACTAAVCDDCNAGFYPSGNACMACDGSCSTCTAAGPSGCTSCPGNEYVMGGPPGTCTACHADCPAGCDGGTGSDCTGCPASFWLNNGMTCDPCHASCVECDGSSNTDCTACGAGSFLDTDGSCGSCTPPCATCETSAVTCTSCTGGLHIDPDNANTCLDCTSVTDCLRCDGMMVCTECNPGYELLTFDDDCQSCSVNNCEDCDADITGCTACSVGYGLGGMAPNLCQPCSDSNCAECYDDFQICDVCDPSHDSVNVDYCRDCPQYCATCTSDTVCTSCEAGFGLIGPVCSLCDVSLGCLTCDGDITACDSCVEGKFINMDGACESCEGVNCATCNAGPDCLTCISSYYMYEAHVCTLCDPNCASCSDRSTCSTCATGYGDDGAGGCQMCTATGCENCDSDVTMCDSCANGYYQHPESGDCTAFPYTCGTYTATECMTCPDGMFLYTDAEYCFACPSNCVACSDRATCTECAFGYGIIAGLCESCGLGLNCAACDSDVNACSMCAPRYYMGAGCLSCGSDCAACTDAVTCTECDSGFGIIAGVCTACTATGCEFCDTDVTTCSSCPTGSEMDGMNCKVCSYEFLHEGTTTPLTNCDVCSSDSCTSCADGYFTHNIDSCHQCPPNCKTCSDPMTCTACYSGHQLMAGACNACTASNCEECDSDLTTCGSCAEGYRMSIDGMNCEACSLFPGCDVCDTDHCMTCVDGKFIYPTVTCQSCGGNCEVCEFYPGVMSWACGQCDELYGADPMGLCVACDPASNCKYCDGGVAAVCSDCYSGKYLDGASMTCLACSVANCAVCDTTPPTVCDTCESGFMMVDNTCVACSPDCASCDASNRCDTCDDGFSIGPVCKRCDDLYCAECSDLDTCTSCIEGFYLDTSGDCQPCTHHCLECDDTDCSRCDDRYLLVADDVTGDMVCQYRPYSRQRYCKYEDEQGECVECYHGYFLDPYMHDCVSCGVVSPSSSATVCEMCAGSDKGDHQQMQSWSSSCQDCPRGCLICHTPDTCQQCREGTVFTGSECTEVSCGTSITSREVCEACSEQHFYRTDRHRGMYWDGGRCDYCPRNCRVCESATTCLECRDHYVWDEEGMLCVDCAFTTEDACTSCVIDEHTGRFINTHGLCEACDPYCTSCDGSPALCTSCASTHYLRGVHCISCEDIINRRGCNECNEKWEVWQGEEHYWMQDRHGDWGCHVCPENCERCKTYDTCDRCPDGMYFYSHTRTDTYQCLPCLENCEECADEYICIQCNHGYYIHRDATGRHYCRECALHCELCEFDEPCTRCEENYVLQGSVCVACEELISGCSSCRIRQRTGALVCTQCEEAHYAMRGLCIGCMEHCTSCTDGHHCSQCEEGFCYDAERQLCVELQGAGCDLCEMREGDVSCLTCPVGKYLDLCQACTDPLCEVCDHHPDRCDQCSAGSYLRDEGSTTCVACLPGCESCGPVSGCTHCFPGYAPVYDDRQTITQCLECTGRCRECEVQYSERGDIRGTECVQCDTDHYMDYRGLCVSCPLEGCGSCTDNQYRCVQCDPGYRPMEDGSCGVVCWKCVDLEECKAAPQLDESGNLLEASPYEETVCREGCWIGRISSGQSEIVSRGCVSDVISGQGSDPFINDLLTCNRYEAEVCESAMVVNGIDSMVCIQCCNATLCNADSSTGSVATTVHMCTHHSYMYTLLLWLLVTMVMCYT